jgi:hypothetical protein
LTCCITIVGALWDNIELGKSLTLHALRGCDDVADSTTDWFRQTQTFDCALHRIFKTIDGAEGASCDSIDCAEPEAIESALYSCF